MCLTIKPNKMTKIKSNILSNTDISLKIKIKKLKNLTKVPSVNTQGVCTCVLIAHCVLMYSTCVVVIITLYCVINSALGVMSVELCV